MNDDIIRDIEVAYRSVENPNWSFVAERLKKNPYNEVIEGLNTVDSVVEDTDLNDDYSRSFLLVNAGKSLSLRLSLVGKYACIHDEHGSFLTEPVLQKFAVGVDLLQVLTANDITLLEEADLRREIQFDGRQQPLYAVLFSSDEMAS